MHLPGGNRRHFDHVGRDARARRHEIATKAWLALPFVRMTTTTAVRSTRRRLRQMLLVHSACRLFTAQERHPMCDYSLHNVKTRAAQANDRLVSTTFRNSVTRGFAPVGDRDVAVCISPGTELAFASDVACRRAWGLLPHRRLAERVARFRQVNTDRQDVHHDALEFPSGRIVLVNDLREGQYASVLQLPATPRPATDAVNEPAHETTPRQEGSHV